MNAFLVVLMLTVALLTSACDPKRNPLDPPPREQPEEPVAPQIEAQGSG